MKELLTNILAFVVIGGAGFAFWSLGWATLRGDFKERNNRDEK